MPMFDFEKYQSYTLLFNIHQYYNQRQTLICEVKYLKFTMESSDSDEDRIERDKFADRLKRKDKERTRNIAVPRSGTFNIVL